MGPLDICMELNIVDQIEFRLATGARRRKDYGEHNKVQNFKTKLHHLTKIGSSNRYLLKDYKSEKNGRKEARTNFL